MNINTVYVTGPHESEVFWSKKNDEQSEISQFYINFRVLHLHILSMRRGKSHSQYYILSIRGINVFLIDQGSI